MTVREMLHDATVRFERCGVPDAALDARLLLAFLLRTSQLAVSLDGGREASESELAVYESMVERREAREPLQLITGEADFMGMTFGVTPDVLIPRQDTEILCEEALRRLAGQKGTVLDLGTGSGALAVAIALLSRADVTAVDVSEEALAVARKNAARLGADIRFVHSDLFSAVGGERFDMIVSNPPYISREEMAQLMPEVRREPELALYGGEDGLDFYRKIAKGAKKHLNKGGCVLLEIGYKQKDAVEELLREHVGEPFALRDYGGNWRVVGAIWGKKDDR